MGNKKEQRQREIQRNNNFVAQGYCYRCHKPRGDSHSKRLCLKCLEEDRIRETNRRAHRQQIGLCECGRTPVEGSKSCLECLEIYKNFQIRKRIRLKTVGGICPNCSNPTQNTIYCSKCSDRATKSTLERYQQRKEYNQCPFCGEQLEEIEQFRCNNCQKLHSKRSIIQYRRKRDLVLTHYGNVCKCCGIRIKEFIEVDHINNDGAKHRKITGRHVNSWIIKNNFPTDLQLLCANCNRGRAKFGICPHQQEISPCISKYSVRKRHQRLRTIDYYGGKCTCCKESNWGFLEFDHINNNGNEHRKLVRFSAAWIIRNNFPDFIQLHCCNCNKAKGLYGQCPHQQYSHQIITAN